MTDPKPTKEEVLQRMKEAFESGDTEVAHKKADRLLLQYIGDEDITKAFYSYDKWYA